MEEIINDRQRSFKLTRDLVPIYFSGFGKGGATFVCPLPIGYKKMLNNLELITSECKRIKEDINNKVKNVSSPFENILIGYEDRTEREQRRLLTNFQITRLMIDNRGLYGVWAGSDVNSGDIYLSTDILYAYNSGAAGAFRELFEEKTAFACHNIDWYWQALLTREFCAEYFNFLNSRIFNK